MWFEYIKLNSLCTVLGPLDLSSRGRLGDTVGGELLY